MKHIYLTFAATMFVMTATAVSAFAVDTCIFKSNRSRYEPLPGGGVIGPPERIELAWTKSTGAIQSWSWAHAPIPYFSYAPDKGHVMLDAAKVNYYRFDIGMTYEGAPADARFSSIGFLAPNAIQGNWTFASVWEGSQSLWFVARGSLHCN